VSTGCLLAAAALCLASARLAGAQGLPHPIPAGDSALSACARAAARGDKAEASRNADAAERAYRAAPAAPNDPTPSVRVARVIAECRIPVAWFMSKGKLASEAEALLTRALSVDSTHWEARYTLGLLYYHSPGFLGRRGDAIRQFETLLQQQGQATEFPEQAAPYVYVGDLYKRQGRAADAVAVWRRGAALFPNDTRLKRRLATAGS
jgi:tetratricopeptide (TPR) repeat protein